MATRIEDPTTETTPGNLPAALSSFVGREQELREVRRLLADRRLLTLTGPGGSGKTRLALAAVGSGQWAVGEEIRGARGQGPGARNQESGPTLSFPQEGGSESRGRVGPAPAQSSVLPPASSGLAAGGVWRPVRPEAGSPLAESGDLVGSPQSFADGIWLVELAPLADSAYLAPVLAAVLGVREQSLHPLVETLVEFLESKQLLLLLDNCEHLLDGCADLVQRLLQRALHLTILTTSREPLGVAGEVVWQVPPLSLPAGGDRGQGTGNRDRGIDDRSAAGRAIADSGLAAQAHPRRGGDSVLSPQSSVLDSDAVRLFVERARERQPGFALSDTNAAAVVRICARLDGLPLALELAAAWVGVLSLEQIAARLDHALELLVTGARTAPARQQTLRATLDWSYALLAAPEQALLRRLSVFAGPFVLEALEAVAGETVGDVLAILWRLAGASLVAADETRAGSRLRLLETVRAYGRERLLASGEAADALRRHATYYCELAEAAEPRLGEADQDLWLERLDAEYENLRAALAWSLSREGDLALGLRTGGALRQFWEKRGYWSEGLRWLEDLLAHAKAAPARERARLLNGVALLNSRQGYHDRAELCAREALALFEELGDQRGQAATWNTLGLSASARGDKASARRFFEAAADRRRAIGDLAGVAAALGNIGTVCIGDGDYAGARRAFQEALAAERAAGMSEGSAWTLVNLGTVALFTEDYPIARRWFERALPVTQAARNSYLVSHCVHNLGAIALGEGDLATAERLIAESLELVRALNWRAGIATALDRLARIACRQGDYPRARTLLDESLRMRVDEGGRAGIAEGLASFAMLAAAQGQPQRAARLFGAAAALEAETAIAPIPLYRSDREQALASLSAALSQTALEAARARGAAMNMDEAVAYALDDTAELEAPALGVETPLTFIPAFIKEGAKEGTRAAPPQPQPQPVDHDGLTDRELAVLRLIAAGRSNKGIALELSVSVRTVEHQITSLYQKINVQSKAEATAYALRHQLDQPSG